MREESMEGVRGRGMSEGSQSWAGGREEGGPAGLMRAQTVGASCVTGTQSSGTWIAPVSSG